MSKHLNKGNTINNSATLFAALFLGLVLATPNYAAAATSSSFVESINKVEPIYLNADESEYFTKDEIVRANGNVVVTKGPNRLTADKIIYFKAKKIIVAEGNIILTDADGNSIKSDKIILDESLEYADMDKFNGELADKSRIKADKVKRLDANTFEMEKGAYSPCPVCEGKSPLWELKANKVKLDNIEQKVSYDDVTLEFLGVPIFYSPILFHPTPDADNKSGFLVPSFTSSPNFGNALEVPYFLSLSNNQDITFSPMFTTEEGIVMKGQYRYLHEYANLNLAGSFTNTDQGALFSGDYNGESRGHIEGEGEINLSENWKFDFEGKHASDDTYLRKFEISDEDILNSRLTLSRVAGRKHFNVQGLIFQGLNQEVLSDNVPIVLPHLDAHYETEKGVIPKLTGSKFYVDANGFSIARKDSDNDNTRINTRAGLSIPLIMGGSKLELDTNLHAAYYTGLDPSLSLDGKESDTRFIYNAGLDWSYPFIKYLSNDKYIVIEPQYNLYFSEELGQSSAIPNEDSQDLELSDVNIFASSLYRGQDLQEDDLRMHYGLRLGYYNKDFKSSFLIGQKYKFDTNNDLASLDLGERQSNIVGRADISLADNFSLHYSTEIDKDDFQFSRNSLAAAVNYDKVKLDLDYNYISNIKSLDSDNNVINNSFANGDKLEEISLSGELNVYNEWSVLGGARYDLSENSEGFVSAYGGLKYAGECMQLTLSAKKEFISVEDVDSGISYGFRIGLKNLGNLGN